MDKLGNNINKYFFKTGIRVLDTGGNEIRLRTGIWNFEEAILDLSEQSDDFKCLVRKVIQNLQSPTGIDDSYINNIKATQDDKSNLKNILNALKDAGYVETEENLTLTKQMIKAIFGGRDLIIPEGEFSDSNRTSLFISDSEYAYKSVENFSSDMKMCVKKIDEKDYVTIAHSNFTSNINALDITEKLFGLKKTFSSYKCILGCFLNPQIQMLRNINRIITELKMPLVLAFFDGPFIHFLSVDPPKTGCFECFETRLLSRLEDHVAYHDFVRDGICTKSKGLGCIPIINILTNLLLTEAFIINNAGSSRFSGRVLSVYLPNLEIQVQDLLRIPFCPACGSVAKSKFEEMNLSTRRIVDDIISHILRTESQKTTEV